MFKLQVQLVTNCLDKIGKRKMERANGFEPSTWGVPANGKKRFSVFSGGEREERLKNQPVGSGGKSSDPNPGDFCNLLSNQADARPGEPETAIGAQMFSLKNLGPRRIRRSPKPTGYPQSEDVIA
jgi:hypothetical protein